MHHSLQLLQNKNVVLKFQNRDFFLSTGGKAELLSESNYSEVSSEKYILITSTTDSQQSDTVYGKACSTVHLALFLAYIKIL